MRSNVLFCYSRLPSFTNAVRDYVHAFGAYSQHNLHYYDMDSGPLDIDLAPYDCIIFNYCFWARCLALDASVQVRIAAFSGRKIAILQDEYDYFLWHEQTLIALGIQTIVTCVPPAHWRDVFRAPAFDQVEFIHALTGYVPQSLLELPPSIPLAERPWLIGYRSRPVPFAYGRLTQEKRLIGDRMRAICTERGLAVDIDCSEESRIYGPAWPAFIGSCRAVLGTESGSNVFDFDGTLKPAIDAFLRQHPDADFETVHQRFLQAHDGRIAMNQVSPRIFEAIALGTALVLFEGRYSGVVQPGEHYIALRKDFGNVEQVLAQLDDLPALEAMTQRAHEAVIASGKYHFRTFVHRIDAHIAQRVAVAKGWQPVLAVVGWRVADAAPLMFERRRGWCMATASALDHRDAIPDPIVQWQFNSAALRRSVLRRYESVLYSGTGRRLHAALRAHRLPYRILRRMVRLLTLRW